MNLIIPSSLVAAYRALPWDDRGILCELPAGGNRTWGNTHTDIANQFGTPIDQFGLDINAGAGGKVMLHSQDIPSDWVIDAIPPIGTAVWQIKGHDWNIVRTSTIGALHGFSRPSPDGRVWPGEFIAARLFAAGPRPGEPVGGDSGSICFVRHKGQWKALGICNTAGHCQLPFWDTTLFTNGGSTIQPRANSATDHDNWSKTWYDPNETTFTIMRELIIPNAPSHRRVVGMFKEEDDGTDNICLDILEPPAPITRLEIRGAGSDKWAWPDNGINWIIRAARLPDGCLRLWFKASAPSTSYSVWVNGNQTTNVLVKDLAPKPPEPAPAPAKPQDWSATNDERQYLLDKIAAMQEQNAKQAALILRLRETFSELLKP